MLERTDAITNEILEPIMLFLAYPTVDVYVYVCMYECMCVCIYIYIYIYIYGRHLMQMTL
jgi:hypothetical protein